MNTLHAAYKILYGLEHKNKDTSISQVIGPEAIGISEEQWLDVVQALLDDEYIKDVKIYKDILGETNIDIKKCRITLKGAEYLRENSTMRKIAKAASDIITIAKP